MKSDHRHFTAPGPEVEVRVDAALARLSLEEKIDLLSGQANETGGNTLGIAHAGIPALKMADASVGVHWWTDRSTTYPASIALAATWDRELAYRNGAALGRDARARGIHIVLGPGVNLYRSPLCGRNFEYMGEDPCLAAGTVTGFIRGLQGQGVSATVKHYAVNYQEFERYRVSSDVDERTLRELYLPAFRAAVQEAGTGAVMTAYNRVNGIHCSRHRQLIREILKDEWGFAGLVMSDWDSTYDAVDTAHAGLDLEMPFAQWLNRERLLPAVRDGRVPVAVIDDKVRRLLRLIFCFGWDRYPQQDDTIPIEDPDTAAVSLEVARRACVLLKNENNFLPLDPHGAGTIAVIGPHAVDMPIGGGGSAQNKSWRTVNILDGMRASFGHDRVRHSVGLPESPAVVETVHATSAWETPDGQPGLRVEYFNNSDWTGTPVLERVELRLNSGWTSMPIKEGVRPGACSIRWSGAMRPERTGVHAFVQSFAAPFRVRLDGKVIFDNLDGARLLPARHIVSLEAGRSYALEVLYRQEGGHLEASLGWTFVPGDDSIYQTRNGRAGVEAEYFNNSTWAGIPVLARVEPRIDHRWGCGTLPGEVCPADFSARWTGVICPSQDGLQDFVAQVTGQFRVRVNGETLFDTLDGAVLDASQVTVSLKAGQPYPVEVLYRRAGAGQAEICVSWQSRGMPPEMQEAVRLARSSDVVIFCGGHSPRTEGEMRDRSFGLPAGQEALLLALAEVNPRLVAVITAGGNVDMRRWIDKVKALLFAWYPGQEGGTAVAGILSGAVNPAGRLPVTFERSLADRSSRDCYHDSDGDLRVQLTDGVFGGHRHHDWTGVAPLFPFGFGLSYTTFAYENLQLPPLWRRGGKLRVRCDIVNTGSRAGTEVVQLYLGDREASAPRPLKELKDFAAVALEPGERRTVTFELDESAVAFFSPAERRWVEEPGAVDVYIAASAADVRLHGTVSYEE